MTTAEKKGTKPKEWNDKWSLLSDIDIVNAAVASVHYSFKYNNSNLNGGIRLSKRNSLDIPYVAGITYNLNNSIPLEYINSKFCKTLQVLSYIEYLEQTNPAHKYIALFYDATQEHFEYGTDNLTGKQCRLPQILLPIENTYISASPVCPASLAHIVISTAKDKEYWVKKTFLEIGGANKFNVGRWASKRTTYAIVCSAPKENRFIKQALMYFHKGVSITPNRRLLFKYYKWINGIRNTFEFTNADNRAQELVILQSILGNILKRGSYAYNMLQNYIEILDSDEIDISKDVPFYSIVIGVIDPSKRDSQWVFDFANHLANTLSTTPLMIDNVSSTLNFNEITISELATTLRGML